MKGRPKSNRSQTRSTASKDTREHVLATMLTIIKDHPGIRPSDLNRRLNMEQSDSLRDVLIRRGLIRKVKDGRATHLYAR
jgi:Mn-dependent DtxR family transcriptional regulator